MSDDGPAFACSRFVSEFVGTYLLVLTVGCNVIAGNPTWGVTSIACVLMVAIYALGSVSGAHFNPAVTVAIALCGKIDSWAEAAKYCFVQVIAGTLAGLTYWAVFGSSKVFNLEPQGEYTWYEVIPAEVLYTCMLCFVVLNVACSSANEFNQYYGLAIGFVIIAGGHAAGPISGGCFNPAVAFGIDISSTGLGFGWCFAYFAYEFMGAALAALLFRLTRPEEWDSQVPSLIVRKCISEYLGTFFLVLTVGLNVLHKSPAAAWSIACSLMCMIYALGTCSGAHFNPAVTAAIMMSGRSKCPLREAIPFMLSQIFGGLSAGITYSLMCKHTAFALGPAMPKYGWMQCAVAEIVFTFVLCFVVLHCATAESNTGCKDMVGLAIGMCVTVGGFAIGAISGGSLNPAVSIGIDFSNAIFNSAIPVNWLAYSLFELVGAAVAAIAFFCLRPSEYQKPLGYQQVDY